MPSPVGTSAFKSPQSPSNLVLGPYKLVKRTDYHHYLAALSGRYRGHLSRQMFLMEVTLLVIVGGEGWRVEVGKVWKVGEVGGNVD